MSESETNLAIGSGVVGFVAGIMFTFLCLGACAIIASF